MVSLLVQNGILPTSLIKTTQITTLRTNKTITCSQSKTPFKFINKIVNPNSKYTLNFNDKHSNEVVVEVEREKNYVDGKIDSKQKMMVLCGVGYWVQGFRCFPWLALNFHMAQNLSFDPFTLQFVQYSSILPMVAKPLYGILSDVISIAGAHRIPYLCIGVLLQVLSWGSLALIPFVGDILPTLMVCVLLSNLGAAITEVVQDALIAEYGQKQKMVGLQSYTFMAIAVAGIIGNLVGGVLLSKTHPRTLLVIFAVLLLLQLFVTLSTKEEWLGLSKHSSSSHLVEKGSILSNVKGQFSGLFSALSEERISHPLIWAVASISMVPMLTGSMFCYQTQFLNLDPQIIGMSKVIGQMLLLSLTVLYDRFWKNMPLRKLMTRVQMLYAASLLLDFVLVKQINLKIGIPNDVFALCFSGLAETLAIFKTVPFFVLIGSLCPPGCEASVTAFVASALTMSVIVSGFFGIELVSLLGITSENYSSLPLGIMLQCLAAIVPLIWINSLPLAISTFKKERVKSKSKRIRRNQRMGKVLLHTLSTYRRERESEKQS